MPIDKNGIILPKSPKKSKKDIIIKYLKKIPFINIISLFISVCLLFYQGVSFNFEKKQYEKQIENLNMQLKEGYTQIKVSYLQCSFYDINNLYKNKNCIIVKNDLSKFFSDYKHDQYADYSIGYKFNEMLGIDKKWSIELNYLFLNIESFGSRNMVDMKFVNKAREYKTDRKCGFFGFNGFSGLPYGKDFIKLNNNEQMFLGDQEAGKQILIPVVMTYKVYNRKKYVRAQKKPHKYNLPDPIEEYLYRTVYIPKSIQYKDRISDEEFNVKIRDVFEDGIHISLYYEGLG